MHNTMQDYVDEAEETLSLCDLQIEDDPKVSEEHPKGSHNSSSSSSSSSFDQDFFGFFSEEWSRNTSYSNSPENILFCGKLIPSKRPIPEGNKSQTPSPLFRSNSDSFSYKQTRNVKNPGTSRSKSLPVLERSRLAACPSKSRWQVFMFGFGSGKFPTTMELSDIKSRQLRRQSTTAMSGGKGEGGYRRGGNKGWWRLVDVLGCGGGYDKNTTMVVHV